MKEELQAIKEELTSLTYRLQTLIDEQEEEQEEPKPVDGQIMVHHCTRYRFVEDAFGLCGDCAFLHVNCGDDDDIDCRGGYWVKA